MSQSYSRGLFPRRDDETDEQYIERLLDELDKLMKLEYVLQRDLTNVAEIARYAGLRTRDERTP